MPDAEPITIAVQRHPLNPAKRDLLQGRPGQTLISWLVECYPAGFGAGITVTRNGVEIETAELDFVMEPGDLITILVHAGALPAIGPLIVEAIIAAAIGAATSLIFNLIFGRPKSPASASVPPPDPIYSITGAQNAARLGEPVPVLYGRMLTTPDFASQPYSFFSGNNQYLDQILVIGQGDYDLNDVRVGTTPVSALESNAVQWWKFGPADHGQVMGRIEAATGIMENVVSSPEVSDQEFGTAPPLSGDVLEAAQGALKFVAPNRIQGVTGTPPPYPQYNWLQISGTAQNDRTYSINSYIPTGSTFTIIVNENSVTNQDLQGSGLTAIMRWFNSAQTENLVGPFITSKPGATGDRIICDFVFPQGLYDIANSGAISYMSASFEIQYQPVDDAGNPTGAFASFAVNELRATTTPVRLSYAIDVPAGRYRVQVLQTSPPPPSGRAQGNFVWTALKFRLSNPAHPVYGQSTLLAVRIRATNGISGNASSRITADVTRRLGTLGQGGIRASRSPADAFVDIYSNTVYGARRPLSEIDLAELQRLSDHWAGQAFFDGGFAQKSTIWEALTIALQTAAAAPLPLGQLMSVAQDGVKALRTQLFSDANMTRGTLAIGYSFDKPGDPDGIRIEYRDPATWNPLYATWPPGAADPDAVQLFGCTDAGQAQGFAKLLWQKRQGGRKSAQFETELEGLIPRLGDRIAIAAQLPRWARGGVVSRVDGLTLRLDGAVTWPAPAGGYFVVLRNQHGEPSDPIAISRGASDFDVILAAAAPFDLFGTGPQEATHYALGSAIEAVGDFTVANIEHRGGVAVAVQALAYDPAVYAGTLPWLERAI